MLLENLTELSNFPRITARRNSFKFLEKLGVLYHVLLKIKLEGSGDFLRFCINSQDFMNIGFWISLREEGYEKICQIAKDSGFSLPQNKKNCNLIRKSRNVCKTCFLRGVSSRAPILTLTALINSLYSHKLSLDWIFKAFLHAWFKRSCPNMYRAFEFGSLVFSFFFSSIFDMQLVFRARQTFAPSLTK